MFAALGDIDGVGPERDIGLVDLKIAEVVGEDLFDGTFVDKAHSPEAPFKESFGAGAPEICDDVEFLDVVAGAVEGADDAAHGAAGDDVDGETGFAKGGENADMGPAPGCAAAEGEADLGAGDAAGDGIDGLEEAFGGWATV